MRGRGPIAAGTGTAVIRWVAGILAAVEALVRVFVPASALARTRPGGTMRGEHAHLGGRR
jgi:hypothetical protein